MNQDNKLEIHVPQCYTEHRPAFLYAHESFQSTIAEHPIAGQFPEISDGFAVKAAPSNLRDLARGPKIPKGVPVTADQERSEFCLVGKASKANEQEITENVRARSAVMRVLERRTN